mgnify:FL=1
MSQHVYYCEQLSKKSRKRREQFMKPVSNLKQFESAIKGRKLA